MRKPCKKKFSTHPSIHTCLSEFSVIPTNAEMTDFKLVYQRLYDLDDKRLTYGSEYDVDTSATSVGFIPMLSSGKLNTGLYRNFTKIISNYTNSVPVTERLKEDFINSATKTKVLFYTFNYLDKKKPVGTFDDFKKELKRLWFNGKETLFQHVFAGYILKKSVKGLHCMWQLHGQESLGNLKSFNRAVLPSNLERVSCCTFYISSPSDG